MQARTNARSLGLWSEFRRSGVETVGAALATVVGAVLVL